MPNDVRDDTERHRFELDLDGHTAFSNYKRADGVLTVLHTEVPAALNGRGIGSRLVRGILDTARAQGLKVKPVCPFVGAFMDKHPEYADLGVSFVQGTDAQKAITLLAWRIFHAVQQGTSVRKQIMKTFKDVAVRAIVALSLTCAVVSVTFICGIIFASGPVLAQTGGVFQQTVAKTSVSAPIRKSEEHLTLTDFAVGDGIADDTAAVNKALAAQASTGLKLDGLGKTYAVSGDIALPDNAWLENVKVKQLVPNVLGRRTLVCARCTSVRLKNVAIN